MRSWANRELLHNSIVQRMADAAARNGVNNAKPPVLPNELVDWLAQLTLLYGVPTEYLVPDVRLLPQESIRFFYIDRNWLDRLVDGAMSAGVLSTQEKVFNDLFFKQIYQQIDEHQLTLRAGLREENAPGFATTGGVISGFLFRSQVVSGWPGLEVVPYLKDVEMKNIIRMDRLSPNVILCLFYGVPDRVDFIEPAEGLHFGITPKTGTTDFTVSLRGLGFPAGKPYPAGEQIPDPNITGGFLTATGKVRSGDGQPAGVIDVANLIDSITKGMPAGAVPNGVLTPGAFAIQLTQGAGLQSYQLKDKDGKSYPACTVPNNSN